MLQWKFGGTMGDNAMDEMKRLSVVEVEANQIQSSLLYVTRLLTAMRLHAIASDRMQSHAISKKNLSFTTVRDLENASGTISGTESLTKVFLHGNCEQISFIIFFRLSQKGRNEKRDSFYTAKRVSSVHSCVSTSGRIFSPVSPKQVPNVFLPVSC
jgi:hypothetical protein